MARLLVVEDEDDIRSLVARRLVQDGHTVLAVDAAPAALAALTEHGPPDAAILDIGLPGIDGFALLDELRRRWPGLPALFLTALWTNDVYQRAIAAGAFHVQKPFTGQRLHTAVQRLLADLEPADWS